MKRLMYAVFILAVLALATVTFAASDTCYPSGNQTAATAQVYTGKGTFCGISVTNNGAADCTVECYDILSSSATSEVKAITSPLACLYASGKTCIFPSIKLGHSTGIYCVMSGTGCKYNVFRKSGW